MTQTPEDFTGFFAERIPQTTSPVDPIDTNIDTQNKEEQESERFKQDTHYRKFFSIWVMTVVPVWLFLVMVLLFLSAFGLCGLPVAVMTTLLATTTVNILGLAFIVLRGLFPVPK